MNQKKKNKVIAPMESNPVAAVSEISGNNPVTAAKVDIEIVPSITVADKMIADEEYRRKRLERELQELKEKKYEILVKKKMHMEELPHKYGYKNFRFQSEYLNCTNKDRFLTSANQVGKSTVQVRNMIDWATDKEMWPRLWKRPPRQFWYMYPSASFLESEVMTKWIPDILPRGEMEKDPTYGWELDKRGKDISAIHFNSGVSCYFKTYAQDVMKLQGSTVWSIWADEELPEEYWDEINQRRASISGYFSTAFTATIGQKFWYDTMERIGEKGERFPLAWKKQVSLFECREFEDGTPSHITDEYIQRAISLCKNEAEVKKRVYGKFATDSGLKYPTFDRARNIVNYYKINRDWRYFAGVDIGSGGEGHPSAICLVAVNPQYTEAVVFDGWLGDDSENTTDLDVYEKMMVLCKKHGGIENFTVFYDYQAKDFHTICSRRGVTVLKAEKKHDVGEGVIGVLLKNGRLKIMAVPQLEELMYQVSTLLKSTAKTDAVDDYVDAMRYAITKIPFNWDKIDSSVSDIVKEVRVVDAEKKPMEEPKTSRFDRSQNLEETLGIEQEMDYWNQFYDTY